MGKAPKKIAGGPTPDLEEAYEVRSPCGPCLVDLTVLMFFQVDEIAEDMSEEDEKKEKNQDDLSGDKLIQASKKKKVTNTASDKAKNKVKR